MAGDWKEKRVGSEEDVAKKQNQKQTNPAAESLKRNPKATGENVRGAFTKINQEELGSDQAVEREVQAMKEKNKQRFQEELEQNYNVEFAEEDKINRKKKK